jgi:uncharacterized protein (TIGR02996 family)
MPDEQAFVAALADSPDDAAGRLIFADWLDEHGATDRAEFIRLQCELERLAPADPRYPELHVRQLEMLAEHERDWLGDWADRLVRWDFKGGLLHSVTITPEAFLDHGADLFARHPVQRVAFVDKGGRSLPQGAVREVVTAPAMAFVRALEVSGCRRGEPMWAMFGGEVATNAWLAALAGAAHVTRLQELNLTGGTRSGRDAIEPDGWRDFCTAGHLQALRHLDLGTAYYAEDPDDFAGLVSCLAGAAFAGRLRALVVAGCFIPDEAVRQLVTAPALVGLEALDLSGCPLLRGEGLRPFLEGQALPRLTSLGLSYGPDLRQLASSPAVSRLETLRLSGPSGGGQMGIGDRLFDLGRPVAPGEWRVFFRSPLLRNLTALLVGAEAIPAEAIIDLLRAPWAAHLRELRLSYRTASLASFHPLFSRSVDGPTALRQLALPPCEGLGETLARWPGLAGITDLAFAHRAVQDTEHLLQSPFLSCRLSRLDVTESCGTPEAVGLLARCPGLKGLRWLGFGYNGLTPEKLTALFSSPHLRHLEALHLGSESEYMGTTAAALRLLAKPDSFPRLRDVVVGSETPSEAINGLRKRFGPRLRVWLDC